MFHIFSHSSPPHFSPWNCESHPKLRKSFIYHLFWCPTSCVYHLFWCATRLLTNLEMWFYKPATYKWRLPTCSWLTKYVYGKFAEFFWSELAAGYMGARARLHGNRQIFWIASARITPCTKGGRYLSLRECITDVALEFFSLRKSYIYHLFWYHNFSSRCCWPKINNGFSLCIISERHVLGGESQRHWADFLKCNLLPSKDTCRWPWCEAKWPMCIMPLLGANT